MDKIEKESKGRGVNPSNFQRIVDLYPDLNKLLKRAQAFSVGDEEIKNAIQSTKTNWNEILCPHTAVAMSVRGQLTSNKHTVVIATAHPAKFEKIVEPFIGHQVPIPKVLNDLLTLKTEITEIKASLLSLEEHFQIS